MIKECPMNFLCKVVNSIVMFGFEMFFGEMVAVYVDARCLNEGKLDLNKVNPMLMMGSSYYSLGPAVGDLFKNGVAFKNNLAQGG